LLLHVTQNLDSRQPVAQDPHHVAAHDFGYVVARELLIHQRLSDFG
jgi:hypothetical protein